LPFHISPIAAPADASVTGARPPKLNARMRSQYDILKGLQLARNKLTVASAPRTRPVMISRIVVALLLLPPCLLIPAKARAQDVPGIEICTVEKTMERRTSCLQSNVDFLQKTVTKLTADYQQKLDAANRQIESLKATSAGLQRSFDELQTAQTKLTEDVRKKTDTPAAAPKDGPK
jgi:hypothetical protein